ncbi:MAG: MarR family transcriptional regulator [Clostridia bacterium]|nr:MarR family transcriptional regulator [Clostridia bacterium]
MNEPPLPSRPHSDAELQSHPSMLVHEVSRLFFEHMRRTDPPGVLSQHGCRLVLLALLRAEHATPARRGISQREIADETRLKPPTVSGILREMEAEGLVIRETNESDARTARVSLTEAGRAANESIRARLQAADEAVMAGFSEAERETLGRLLLRMRNNLLSKKEGTK